jgi:hypothetical protein
MTGERSPVWLETTHETLARNKLRDWLTTKRSSVGDPAFLVDQKIENAVFEGIPPDGSIGSFQSETTTAGRIFGPNAELRWAMRDADFDVWTIQEKTLGNGTDPLRAHKSRYYCLGRWKPDKLKYVEGYLSVAGYPRPGAAGGDRLYVEVMEYHAEPVYHAPPPAGADAEAVRRVLKEIACELNKPRIVAARFCGVGVGSTPERAEVDA